MSGSEHSIRQGTLIKVFKQMPDATLTQASVTSGTQYPVLAATPNCRILSVAVRVTKTSSPTLEVHLIIDGVTHTHVITDFTSEQWYYIRLNPETAQNAQRLTSSTSAIQRAFLYEGASIAVAVEATGGTGVSDLESRVKYSRM